MAGRVGRFYRRYAVAHLELDYGPVPGGRVLLRRGRVRLEGRLPAGVGRAALEHAGAQVAAAPAADGQVALCLPAAAGEPVQVVMRVLRRGTGRRVLELPAPSRWRRGLAHLALWPGLAGRLLRVLPWLPRRRDPAVRARIARALGLAACDPAPDLAPLPAAPAQAPRGGVSLRNAGGGLAVILPVHDALAHLRPCLARLRAHTDLPWRLVLVEDGSTDPDLRPFLEAWVAAEPRAELVLHDAPRGFAGAVNAGMARLEGWDGPVVLLNSDVTLPDGWASRLVAPLLADGTVASVTPLSNAGELVGAPLACCDVALRDGEADAVDAALRPVARARDLPVLPTGTGFCMALAPAWRRAVPRFDESFGRGYGEEVDWCQKTRALGGRHVVQTGLFVGHEGAASFGPAARATLRARAGERLARRYPRFEAEVAATRAADPLAAERLRAGLAWAAARMAGQGAPLPLYLAHSLGGGAEHWLQERLARITGAGGAAVVLRLGGPRRWQLELHCPGGVTRGGSDSFAAIRALLRVGGPRRVIYSCAVGDPAPEEIPQRLLDLCAGGQGLELLFHDYFPLARDVTLRAEPPPFRSETAQRWAALWRPALERAEALTVFSEASRRIVAAAHPDLVPKIRLRPHAPRVVLPRLAPARQGAPRVLGVAGHLNREKGGEVVAALARVFARTGEARIVVLGAVAPEVALPRRVRVLGGYELPDLPHLAARHGITCWLVPSLWPETFSYVTQEVLMTGLPCFGFALGAQGDALARAAAARGQGAAVALRNGRWDEAALLAALRAQPGWSFPAAPSRRVRPRRRGAVA